MKKSFLKIIVSILVFLMLFPALVACDNSSENSCDHEWNNWEITQEATCTQKGEKERICDICGYKDTKSVPKESHTYENGVCSACGDVDEDYETPTDIPTESPTENPTETPMDDANRTIAVVAKGETHAFWQAAKAGAEQAGKDYGYKVTFRGPTDETEEYIVSQREMIQTALNDNNTKALVLATIGLGFGEELKQAFEKGIPVVEFDSGLYNNGADITAGKNPVIGSVATDNKAAAGVVADNFFKYLKDNGLAVDGYKVGIIQHDSTSTGLDRAAGFKEGMEKAAQAEGITLDIKVEVKANNAGEYKLGLITLKEWGAQAIFMTNEFVANEVFPEVADDAEEYKHILFCGFDAGTNQYIWMKDHGENYALLVGSLVQDAYNIGYRAVELTVKKLAGESVSDVHIAGVWCNFENVDEQKEKNIFYFG